DDPQAVEHLVGMHGAGYREEQVIGRSLATHMTVIIADAAAMPHETAEDLITSSLLAGQDHPPLTTELTQEAHDKIKDVPGLRIDHAGPIAGTPIAAPELPNVQRENRLKQLEDRLVREFFAHVDAFNDFMNFRRADERAEKFVSA